MGTLKSSRDSQPAYTADSTDTKVCKHHILIFTFTYALEDLFEVRSFVTYTPPKIRILENFVSDLCSKTLEMYVQKLTVAGINNS